MTKKWKRKSIPSSSAPIFHKSFITTPTYISKPSTLKPMKNPVVYCLNLEKTFYPKKNAMPFMKTLFNSPTRLPITAPTVMASRTRGIGIFRNYPKWKPIFSDISTNSGHKLRKNSKTDISIQASRCVHVRSMPRIQKNMPVACPLSKKLMHCMRNIFQARMRNKSKPPIKSVNFGFLRPRLLPWRPIWITKPPFTGIREILKKGLEI